MVGRQVLDSSGKSWLAERAYGEMRALPECAGLPIQWRPPFGYVLGSWLSAARAFSPSCTGAVDELLTGTGASALVLPTFTAPALPSGVTAALPGALTRIFALISKMKLHANYTEAIGTDLGIVGSAETEKPLPKFLADLQQGVGCQCVKLTFYKYTHMGVYMGSRMIGAQQKPTGDNHPEPLKKIL
jgi:hypothetical protein